MADKAATLQQEQIKQLEEKMKQIDSMAKDQVYADPVKKVQTEMLYQLVAMRKSMAQGIEMACQVAATGGSGAGGKTVSKEDYDKLVADNKKLAYRITHLTRALDSRTEVLQSRRLEVATSYTLPQITSLWSCSNVKLLPSLQDRVWTLSSLMKQL